MKKTYEERLKIPIIKTALDLFTKSGLKVAIGYERIVIGGRGPYIEFIADQILKDNIYVPVEQQWRFQHTESFYNEYRTKQDNVKIYHQKKIVDYADYKVGFWYISPFDLRTEENNELIEKLK